MSKKYRIVSPIRFFIFVAIVTITVIFTAYSLLGFANIEASVTETYKIVTVTENDSLWNIAEEYCDNNTDTREYINDICEINDISPEDIQPGDTVLIPVEA